MVQGQPYKGFQKKSPIYQFPLLATRIMFTSHYYDFDGFLWLKEDLTRILYLGLQQQCLLQLFRNRHP